MAAAPETGPRSVQANASLISACGLYCGCCSSYLKGKCASCMDAATSQNRAWCPVLKCCKEKGYATCAQCTTFTDPRKCPTHHNMISRVIGYCLGSDRSACIDRIREIGPEAYAAEMAANNRQSIKKTSWNPWEW